MKKELADENGGADPMAMPTFNLADTLYDTLCLATVHFSLVLLATRC